MNFPAALNAHYPPVLLCNSCCNLYFPPYLHSSSSSSPLVTNGNHFRRRFRSLNPQEKLVSRHSFSSSREGIARCATSSETETEPESNKGKGKELHEDGGAQLSSDPLTQNNVHLDQPITDQGKELSEDGDTQLSSDPLTQNNVHLDPPITDQSKDQYADIEIRNLRDSTEKIDGDLKAQGDIGEKDGTMEVTSGSPLPGLKQTGELIKIPKASADILKDQVFGFDTFFVTSQEPYEGGILFKGNLRGQAAKSYEKIKKRMEDKFGDQYKLFLLINPEDDKPVAVVVPKQTLQPEATAVPEWFAAGSFGLVTIFTLLLRNVPALQSNLLSTFDNLEMLKVGLPGALVTAIVLGAHEVSHLLVSKSIGAKLGVPYFVPSWQIGSFGAITRIISILSNREDLLKLAVAGPLAGFTVGLVLLLLGFILPPGDGIGIIVDASVFHESFLAGGIAKLLLGDALKEGSPLSLNPLVIWAWAGLLINAINSIPAGELDGGRISFALWGRKAWARVTGVSIALLGISSLFNDVAFYWAILVFFLQRGPIAPLSEEITDPESKYVALGITVLLLGLLVCLPYPFPFTTESILLD